MENLRQKIFSSAGWMSLLRYFSLIINIIGGIYLARMIDPAIFGRVGLMIALVSFITMASMWGYFAALMKRSGSIRDNLEYINTLFTIDFLISSATLVVLFIVAFVFPNKFGFILAIMALSKAPMMFTELYRAILSKEMHFQKIFVIHFFSMFLSMIIACFMAYHGFGLWALVARYCIENMCIGLLSYMIVPYRLKFLLNKGMAKDFFHFGKYVIFSNFCSGSYTNVDRISIGSFIGSAGLGFYERAHSIASYAYTLFWDAVGPVFKPLFGNLKDDRMRLSKVYNLGSAFFFRIYLMIFLWLGVFIPEIITIVFGEKWLPTVPVFRILLPFFILTNLRHFNRTLQLYTGNSKVMAKIQVIEVASFLVCLFPLLVYFKIKGVALALNISVVLSIIGFLFYAFKIVDVDLKKIFVMPCVIAAIWALSVYCLRQFIFPVNYAAGHVMINGIIVLGFYILLSVIFEWKFIKEVVLLVRGK